MTVQLPSIRFRGAKSRHLPNDKSVAPLEGFSDRLSIYGMAGWEQRMSIQQAVDKLIDSTPELSE